MNVTHDPTAHPDEDTLFGLANYLTTEEGEELAQLEAHVAQCAECQGTVAELAGVVVRRREPPARMLTRFLEDVAQDAAERAARERRRIPWGWVLLLIGLLTSGAALWRPGEPPREEVPSVPRRTGEEEPPAHDREDPVTSGDGIAPPASPGR